MKRGHSNVLNRQSNLELQTENELSSRMKAAPRVVQCVPLHPLSLFIMYAMIT